MFNKRNLSMRMIRKYDREFKINAVKLMRDNGKSIIETARDLGIPESTLRDWFKEFDEYGEQCFPGSGFSKQGNEEIHRLKKALADVTIERDILKKAIAIFSKA